jgi:ABC-type phosphate/phosphonate transport system substrate-binding protein
MTPRLKLNLTLLALMLAGAAATAPAADSALQKVGFNPSAAAISGPALLGKREIPVARAGEAGTYVFSAPPRESAQAAAEIYAPLAEYLSQVTGKKVVFHQASDWLAYQTEMRRGDYDLVFDGPHFNSWRITNLQHHVLVKAPGDHSFVVVVKKTNDRIHDLKQLAGRGVCGMSPPNLGTLTVLDEFDNPLRQPIIQNTQGWDNIYRAMAAGQCSAAILPVRNLAKYDPQGTSTRVIFRAKTYPNQALSAGPRVSPADQARIAQALATPDARAATAGLRDAYALAGDFQPVGKDEYAGVASILKDTWGYR